MRTQIFTVLAALVMLTACETDGAGNKQIGGTLLGAGGGALLGSQIGKGDGRIVASVIGGLAGAWLGNEIGASLDKADQAALGQASNRAYSAPIGQTISWNNPNSGNSGTIVPVRDGYDNRSGAYCREFQQTITVGGKSQQAYGTACQQPDGSWKILGS